jgi:hypothetical protein
MESNNEVEIEFALTSASGKFGYRLVSFREATAAC